MNHAATVGICVGTASITGGGISAIAAVCIYPISDARRKVAFNGRLPSTEVDLKSADLLKATQLRRTIEKTAEPGCCVHVRSKGRR